MKRSVLLFAVLATACRDVPERFVSPDPFDSVSTGETGRLTWNVYEDHSPVWNATSDTVYYSARSYPGFPVSGGLLLAVPRTAGRAKLMLESLQEAVRPQPWLAAPALSPSKDRIAFFELIEVHNPNTLCTGRIACRVPGIGGPDTSLANVPLVRGVLRVRGLNGSGPEASVPVAFQGYQENPEVWTAYPFQRQYERDGAEVFRPSWSPDGNRVVFSDGLRLYVWTVGSANAVAIPNTDDGVFPAWSPTGDVIAFMKLFRGASHSVVCDCYRQGAVMPALEIRRIIYADGGARLRDVNDDSSGWHRFRNLGAGESPAWSPNGQALVFNRAGQLFRANADGTGATAIPNTQGGHEPAISPDGRWLTFSRDTNVEFPGAYSKPYDIWVVNF